jgi:long-subunit fatty acid transport protein
MKGKHLWGTLIVLFISAQFSFAQTKDFETREQTWFGYFNQTRFTKRSGMWVDLHLRLTNNFVEQVNLSILRAGYTYYISDQVRLTAGYAYVTQYGLAEGQPDVPEHRPWQQIQWVEKKKGFTMMQWFRIDERFRTKVVDGELTDSYNFNWRFRYNIGLTFPLKGKVVQAKTPFLFFNDELHINAGKNIVYNYFDQNRLFLGLGYQFTSHLNAQLGYMYIFQQLPAGDKYANIHVIRFFVFHNLDLRKSE